MAVTSATLFQEMPRLELTVNLGNDEDDDDGCASMFNMDSVSYKIFKILEKPKINFELNYI